MKKESGKLMGGKAANWLIVGLVLAGTLLISGIADVSEGSGIMMKIFIFFLGSIIVVQIVPGLLLFGAMLKGISSVFSKKAKVTLGEEKK